MTNTIRPPLIITEVNINVRGVIEKISGISFEGTEDIFDHPRVREYLQAGGRIVGIAGIIRYKDFEFDFRVSYNIGIKPLTRRYVKIKVRMRGQHSDPKMAQELYEIIYKIWKSHFG